MSDVVSFKHERVLRNELIVRGYIRGNYCVYFPTDIVAICYHYYEVKDSFIDYDSNKYKLYRDGCAVQVKSPFYLPTIYGKIAIPSCSAKIHIWTFKIHKMSFAVSIGIDETRHIRKEQGSFSQMHGCSQLYGIYNDGEKIQWNKRQHSDKKDAKLQFKQGDTVQMELDLVSHYKTLSYLINNEPKRIAFKNIAIGPKITYCMAIHCGWTHDNIEILSYFSS